MKNRLLIITLIFTLVLSLAPFTAFTANAQDASGIGWSLVGGTLTIANNTGMNNWTAVRETHLQNVITAIIQPGIGGIGSNVLQGARSLTSVTIPATVWTIDRRAFADCVALETVIFEENSQLWTIAERTFYNTALTSITIPASIEWIQREAFRDSALESITFLGRTPPEFSRMLSGWDVSPFYGVPPGLRVYIPAGRAAVYRGAEYAGWPEDAVFIAPTAEPRINSVTLSGNNLFVDFDSNDTETLIIAFYGAGGRFLGFDRMLADTVRPIPIIDGGGIMITEIRVMMWENMNNMIPLDIYKREF